MHLNKRIKYFPSVLIVLALVGCGARITGPNQPLETYFAEPGIDRENREVATEELFNHEYFLLYFSAHWCPPCQAFTPKLVHFYEENGGGQLFQLLFISCDKSEAEMFDYMNETKMPWPAVQFNTATSIQLKDAYGKGGIPRLVLVDRDGKIIQDSYNGKKYLGPQIALEALKELLETRDEDVVDKGVDNALPTPRRLARKYQLNGFGEGTFEDSAIISGKMVGEGVELEPGVVVEDITETYVEISRNGNRYRLYPPEE